MFFNQTQLTHITGLLKKTDNVSITNRFYQNFLIQFEKVLQNSLLKFDFNFNSAGKVQNEDTTPK